MWSAKIESKSFEKGILQIGVIFTNGFQTFSEPFIVRSDKDIDEYISSRIKYLNTLEAIQIPLGDFTPKEDKPEL